VSAFNGKQLTCSAAAQQVQIPAGSYNLLLAAIGANVYIGGVGVSTTNGLPIIAGAQPIVLPIAAGQNPGLYAVGAGGTLAWMQAA
jgi:hypothetical protein